MDKSDIITYGTIFSIEEFAVNDGPGIRTTLFLKGCPLRCAWCHNPEGISPKPQYLKSKGERTLCGYQISARELANQILKNKDIYLLNEGGVTLTGGEPLLQADFVLDLLQKINPEIHTAIETSGYAPTSIFQKVISLLDLVMYDVKHIDPACHKMYTGVDNRLILHNLDYLCASGKDFIVRIPLIPGANDTKKNMLDTLDRIKGAKSLLRVELLRYHKMAGAKYSMIGQEYNPPFDPDMSPRVYDIFKENNIKTIVL